MTARADTAAGCCPAFDPTPWDETEISWHDRPFVKDRVRSVLHVPLNFGAVVRRNVALIRAAGAQAEPTLVLSDENSPWGADVYIEAAADVPGAAITRLSGTFLSKVFEGPFRDIPRWIRVMNEFAAGRGKTVQQLFFYYTTCPRCAKRLGKNYVVLLARV